MTQLPPLRTGAPAELVALLRGFEQTQWLPPERLLAMQLAEFGQLVRHAYPHCAHFRQRLDAAGLVPGQDWSMDSFRKIPLLTRRELLDGAEDVHCTAVPPAHGQVTRVQSSGSTGQTVAVLRTALSARIWMALTLRDHLWRRRDLMATLAVIRPAMPVIDDAAVARERGWGPPASLLFDTGPCYMQPLSLDVARQADWLLEKNPAYLLSFPTNIAALLDRFAELGRWPSALREVRTVSETVSAEFRARCRKELQAGVVDTYSAQEVGVMALQCPTGAHYHVQAESLLLEVIDDEGRACRPGEIGRIVVTDLHNYATPLVRYEIRDYAEVGEPCACGRGLPTLTRILGRRRNMLLWPNGERHWPMVGFQRFREVAPLLQYQFVQLSLDQIEVRLHVATPLSAAQEARLGAIILEMLGHRFELKYVYFSGELPRTRGGKFEEFISMVA